jgi:hypothetical protein
MYWAVSGAWAFTEHIPSMVNMAVMSCFFMIVDFCTSIHAGQTLVKISGTSWLLHTAKGGYLLSRNNKKRLFMYKEQA